MISTTQVEFLPEKDDFIKTKHGKTRYIQNGDLSPVVDHLIVFVCGISSHSYSYFHLARSLMKELQQTDQVNAKTSYRFLRYDKYGRGKSSNPSDHHTSELFVEQLHSLLSEVELKPRRHETRCDDTKPRITVIGFSMGGAISIHFAAKYPELVDDLILFSPAGATW